MQRVIEETADGVATLYIPQMDEHYHSVKGALTEAQHVYIESALGATTSPHVSLLEMGFGTGLNAFLTLLEAEKQRRTVRYTTLELYPLPLETVMQLGYAEAIASEAAPLFEAIHRCEWGKEVAITPYFTLCKQQVDLLDFRSDEATIDVVYFDAFAPEKQPELWSETLFATLYNQMSNGGVLTTYCAKGEVRRRLQRAGFTVERLAGPPNGKREILRATKG